jgi:proline racemase
MHERQAWAERRLDHYRLALMREPRGHRDMWGALLTEAATADGHAGVLFMHGSGWPALNLQALMAVATLAVGDGLLSGEADTWRFDTVAGRVTADVRVDDPSAPARAAQVQVTGVPAFVWEAGVPVTVQGRTVRADVAFGGVFHAVVDAESVGIPLRPDRLDDLRRMGMAIAAQVSALRRVQHPQHEHLAGVAGTVFTGPAMGEAHLCSVAVGSDGQIDRSASGTATAAVMAVLTEMGLLLEDQPFVQESLLGLTLTGRVARLQRMEERTAVVPVIEGRAWMTGRHTFLLDADDPLRSGVEF